MQTNSPEATQDSPEKQMQNSGRWKLLAVVAVCAFPIIASYFTYYIIKPTGRNNYGALIDPRLHPIPEAQLQVTELDGKAAPLAQFKGKWVLLQTGVDQRAIVVAARGLDDVIHEIRGDDGKGAHGHHGQQFPASRVLCLLVAVVLRCFRVVCLHVEIL